MIKLLSNYFEKSIFDCRESIKTFHELDMFKFDKFEQDLRAGQFESNVLVVEDYQTSTIANNLSNVFESYSCAFVLLSRYNIRTQENKTEFLDNLEYEINQIKAKMIYDKKQKCHFIKGLDVSSMTINRAADIAEHAIFRCSFNFEHKAVKLDSQWTK